MKLFLVIYSLVMFSFTASAEIIVLDFEDITAYPSANSTLVQDFYDGGTSSNGSSGTDYGIGFSDNALSLCLNTLGVTCSNTSRGGLGDPDSQLGALFFLTGSETFMNVEAGFDTGFSFLYAAITQAGSISVYDDVNGTGNLLATTDLVTTVSNCASGYNAGFCPFNPFGIAFDGIAKSVSFAGVANQITFDDVTFGSIIAGEKDSPQDVPEPGTLAIFALGLIGLSARRYKKS